jgi:CheY-like chemotaxis protein
MSGEPKILVVDDEIVVIKSAQRVLGSEGYDVERRSAAGGNPQAGTGQL